MIILVYRLVHEVAIAILEVCHTGHKYVKMGQLICPLLHIGLFCKEGECLVCPKLFSWSNHFYNSKATPFRKRWNDPFEEILEFFQITGIISNVLSWARRERGISVRGISSSFSVRDI